MKVSVGMITYNHDKFIGQAIESVLNQITNFEFELIICDDCSPDDTKLIVDSYIEHHNYGYRIKYYRNNRNIGMFENGNLMLKSCSGEFIALCEGDDFWIDRNKLQKQYEILNNNNSISFIFHSSKIIFHDKLNSPINSISNHIKGGSVFSTFDLILFKYNISTSSMFFRKRSLFIKNLENYNLTEKLIQLILSLDGFGFYISEPMSVYRSSPVGVSYGISKLKATKLMISMFNDFNGLSMFKYHKVIRIKKNQIILDFKINNYIIENKNKFYILLSLKLLLFIFLRILLSLYLSLKVNYLNKFIYNFRIKS
jgi:glycosyltransferase involved in cell wall biosynthesis